MFYALQSEVVRIYARLFGYVKPHSRLLIVAIIAAVIHAAADAALPLVMEQVGAYLTNPAEAHVLAGEKSLAGGVRVRMICRG